MTVLSTLSCSGSHCGPSGWVAAPRAGAGCLKMQLGICSSHWDGDVPTGLAPKETTAQK